RVQNGKSRSVVLQREQGAEIRPAPAARRAEEIAGAIGNDPGIAEGSIGRRARERVDGGESAAVGRELEDDASRGRAAQECRAIESPRVERERAVIGIRAVRSSGEGMQQLKARAVGLHLEESAGANARGGASVQGGPVKKSCAVADQGCLRVLPVGGTA